MTLDLDKLEAVGKAATEGVASVEQSTMSPIFFVLNERGDTYVECWTHDNATFIATARDNWQAMIDEIRRLSEEVRDLQRKMDSVDEFLKFDLLRAENANLRSLLEKHTPWECTSGTVTSTCHEFDSSRTCDFCGQTAERIAAESGKIPERVECPSRKPLRG